MPASAQGDIHDQIVISFDVTLARRDFTSAMVAVSKALERLEQLHVPVLEKYVAETSDKEPFFAIIIARLDNPTPTLEDLQNDPAFVDVTHVERNVPIALAKYDDPLLAQQWALEKLGAQDPWNVAPPPGAGKTIVGIIDSGLFRVGGGVHYDLGYVEPLIDCQPQPGYGFPGLHVDGIDQDGHGTLLAGTIAAVPDNTEGVSSAVQPSWNISLLPVKFFGPDAGPHAGHAAIAIAHAVIKGAKVINASWHVATGDAELWMLRLALVFAALGDRLVVIAAGNDGTDNETYPTYPANFGSVFKDHVMTVAASDRDDFKASYSNYGKNIVDIAAPGTAIVSTALYLTGPPRYADYSGTSAAAAFVSSAAALVFALNPPNWDGAGAQGWRPKDVIEHLRASADEKDGLKLACRGGKRLNIARAVYGPLTLTAPTAGTTLVVNVATVITWTVAYSNPRFVNVRVEFITTANVTHHLGTVPIGYGMLSWTPAAVMAGWIRITPTTGNFPVRSGLILVVS
jgi:subtilisin family serine protease